MKKRNLVLIGIIAVLLIAALIGAIFIFGNGSDDDVDGLVYVESVSNITGAGTFMNSRFIGTVESQATKDIQKNSERTIKEIFVEVGDEVHVGDKLFEYDTDQMSLQLEQLKLELASINNSITTTNQQITELSNERATVPEENKIEYTTQIQNLQAQINQYSYDASAKQLEIDRQQTAMENAIVYSDMDGVITVLNDSSNVSDEYAEAGDTSAFITIMALGDYRIKGTTDEMTIWTLSEDMPVIIRSRVDNSTIWTGTISTIDTEKTASDNDEMMYYDGASGETASKYNFYVSIDNADGLILGQHVYIELDYGQGESKEGIWLGEYYIMNEEGGSYIWVADGNDRIAKRKVELGEYDENTMEYQILSGLSKDDLIAYPEERIVEGMKTTTNYEDVMEYEMGDMTDSDGMEDGMMEDGMMEDGMMEDGMTEDGMMEDGMSEEEMLEEGDISDEQLDEGEE